MKTFLTGILFLMLIAVTFNWGVFYQQRRAALTAAHIENAYDYYIQFVAEDGKSLELYRKKGTAPCGTLDSDYALRLVIQLWHDDLVRLKAVDPSAPLALDGSGVMGYYPMFGSDIVTYAAIEDRAAAK